MDGSQAPARRARGRSPAYPAINLERAIQRVGQLYDRDKRFGIPVASVPGIWDYKSLNGPASQVVSALKQFGLVDDEGTKAERVITVSQLAEDLLRHPSSDAREAARKTAALRPLIHQEMWSEYGAHLPSDANLLWRLTRERAFTETGAKEFVRQWRETMDYAQLGEEDASDAHRGSDLPDDEAVSASADSGPVDATDSGPSSAGPSNPPAWDLFGGFSGRTAAPASASPPASEEVPRAVPVQTYPIPIALTGRPPVMISGAFPLSATEWDQFKAVLEAMKPVLVGDAASLVPNSGPLLAGTEEDRS
ncbi:hypothetical protein OCAE111667_19465 [Occultella aeris]|uniref:Uncharacterized protein n=1 Tax=Occultella aeris TaxID=2761496 RepID=A0A7M4DQA6_9MICO|nr:hypothetical protein [Occultella aeris]VZO39650.1 hypothetical protein HALOF300_04344 [Occultella aeris]